MAKTFDEWLNQSQFEEPYTAYQLEKTWNAAIESCREEVQSVMSDAKEAVKAQDATDYVAGYQDARTDCDVALICLRS